MMLWTNQHENVLAVVRERGVFRADGRRESRHFRDSYRWMRAQLKNRIPGATGRSLIWAWTHKHDLRGSAILPRGTPGVRIELEIPEERVLLSDFDAWHFCLCGTQLPRSNADGEDFLRRKRAAVKRLAKESPTDLRCRVDDEFRDEIKASWLRMFDLDAMRKFLYGKTDKQWVQAVFEHFTADEIRGVTRFVAR